MWDEGQECRKVMDAINRGDRYLYKEPSSTFPSLIFLLSFLETTCLSCFAGPCLAVFPPSREVSVFLPRPRHALLPPPTATSAVCPPVSLPVSAVCSLVSLFVSAVCSPVSLSMSAVCSPVSLSLSAVCSPVSLSVSTVCSPVSLPVSAVCLPVSLFVSAVCSPFLSP